MKYTVLFIILLSVANALRAQDDQVVPYRHDVHKTNASGKTATIKFLCDADANLYIDNEYRGRIYKNSSMKINLAKGSYIVKAVSTSNSSKEVKWKYLVDKTGVELAEEIELQKVIDGGETSTGQTQQQYTQGSNTNSEAELEQAEKYYSDKEYAKAFELYSRNFNSPLMNGERANRIGFIYSKGLGVATDDAASLKWFRKSANLGYSRGQRNLGLMYQNGTAVPQNYTEALKWYKKAAEQGDADAEDDLGLMYHRGYGVARDDREALKWFRKSVDDGNGFALNHMGFMYENGYAVTKDLTEAANWYKKSADLGDATGLADLADMYEYGKGVPLNMEKAKELYRQSAMQGNDFAQKACNRLGINW